MDREKNNSITKGNWCDYDQTIFCQEASGCANCEIYLSRNNKK